MTTNKYVDTTVEFKFQSLLCWILYYDFFLNSRLRADILVSILIMLDTVL